MAGLPQDYAHPTPRPRCAWCRGPALRGEDLCGKCLKKWVEKLPDLPLADFTPRTKLTQQDRTIERFLTGIRTVGGSY